jgi:AcrR family transcriptional regulator
MPYTAEHKERTRARIIASARVLFNRHGFEQVSIDDVMKSAGLTRGGFYRHFASKDELYAQAVSHFLTCNPITLQIAANPSKRWDPRELARLLIDTYLSDATLADPDIHCPLVALPSDVARAGLAPRAAYTTLIENMAKIFRAALPADDPTAEESSLRAVSLCVGGMVLARTTDAPKLRKNLRKASRTQALALLGLTPTRGH